MKKIKTEETEPTSSTTSFEEQPTYHFKIHNAIGISTTRHCSFLAQPQLPKQGEKGCVITALGNGLIEWNLDKKKSIRYQQITRDLITSIRRNPSQTLLSVTSHCGELKLLDPSWNILHTSFLPGKILHSHWSFDEKYIITTSAFQGGVISIFEIENLNPKNVSSKEILKIKKDCVFAEMTKNNLLFLCPVRGKRDLNATIELWDNWKMKNEKNLKLIDKLELEGKAGISAIDSNSEGFLVVSVKRHIYLFSTENRKLNLISSFEASGSGMMKCVVLTTDNYIICPSDNKKITIWKDGKLEKSCFGSTGTMYAITWSFNDPKLEKLIVCTDNGLETINLNSLENNEGKIDDEKLNEQLVFHKISCCGTDFLVDKIAVGDLGGNIIIWNMKTELLNRIKIKGGIRCIIWKNSNTVLIGCLDGTLYKWNITQKEPKEIHNLHSEKSHFICMEWAHQQEGSLLVLGDSLGKIHLLEFNQKKEEKNEEFFVKALWQAHPKIQEGNSSRNAEIWSVTFSPCNQFVASASEDQTTRIWNSKTQKHIDTLTGHKAAVTSVDWNITSTLGEVLVTCSDDKTIHLYSSKRTLLHIFNATHIPEWYTLTYLHLENRGDRLVVSTQNGFIFVFELSTKKLLTADKIHQGSIEGLRWKGDIIVTCASDCTAMIMSLSQDQIKQKSML